MKRIPLTNIVKRTIVRLRGKGFETYLVGGAVRDMLLGITPKDYDIATSATPQEIRKVLGKRYSRIIGRRFKLVHYYYCRNRYIEITTFRRTPTKDEIDNTNIKNGMIMNDNFYGTAYLDAWRRDFTVNAIFYDPINNIYRDHTQKGIEDLKSGIVRSIGAPTIRFIEDPIRMIRAIKLVSQYRFKMMENITEAIEKEAHYLLYCPHGRLLLEFEKILRKPYAAITLETMKNFGLLRYFLPYMDRCWDNREVQLGIKLLERYNKTLKERQRIPSFTTSLSLLLLPSINVYVTNIPENFSWSPYPIIGKDIKEIINSLFFPYKLPGYRTSMVISSIILANRMLAKKGIKKILKNRLFNIGKEVMLTFNREIYKDKRLEAYWEKRTYNIKK